LARKAPFFKAEHLREEG